MFKRSGKIESKLSASICFCKLQQNTCEPEREPRKITGTNFGGNIFVQFTKFVQIAKIFSLSKLVNIFVQIDKCISPNIFPINSKFFWQLPIWTNVDFCAFVNTIIYREDFGHPGSEFLFQQTKTFSLVNYNVPSFCYFCHMLRLRCPLNYG